MSSPKQQLPRTEYAVRHYEGDAGSQWEQLVEFTNLDQLIGFYWHCRHNTDRWNAQTPGHKHPEIVRRTIPGWTVVDVAPELLTAADLICETVNEPPDVHQVLSTMLRDYFDGDRESGDLCAHAVLSVLRTHGYQITPTTTTAASGPHHGEPFGSIEHPEQCPNGPHRGPQGPNEDLSQCPLCLMPSFALRPDGETFGQHLPDCSLPRRHHGFCVGGGTGHPRSKQERG